MGFAIAIDGPAAAGKTTAAKKIAEKLECVYIDTGAMYRAFGLYCLRNGISTKDSAAVAAACDNINIDVRQNGATQKIYLNGKDVTGSIRTQEVGNAASDVGTVPEVRTKLVALQQKMAETADVVMEGRDICSSVLPGAQVKVFLTASVDVRAGRRYLELAGKGTVLPLEKVKEDLIKRDYQDTHRDISPLMKVPGAVEIDSSGMTADDVVAKIILLTALVLLHR